MDGTNSPNPFGKCKQTKVFFTRAFLNPTIHALKDSILDCVTRALGSPKNMILDIEKYMLLGLKT